MPSTFLTVSRPTQAMRWNALPPRLRPARTSWCYATRAAEVCRTTFVPGCRPPFKQSRRSWVFTVTTTVNWPWQTRSPGWKAGPCRSRERLTALANGVATPTCVPSFPIYSSRWATAVSVPSNSSTSPNFLGWCTSWPISNRISVRHMSARAPLRTRAACMSPRFRKTARPMNILTRN